MLCSRAPRGGNEKGGSASFYLLSPDLSCPSRDLNRQPFGHKLAYFIDIRVVVILCFGVFL